MQLNVPLMAQVGSLTCWHAAMRMISSYKASANIDPTRSVSWLSSKVNSNKGLECQMTVKLSSLSSIKAFWDTNSTPKDHAKVPHNRDCSEPLKGLKDAGFHPLPSQPDPIEANWLERQMNSYGPAFAGGYWLLGSDDFHAVVITGVDPATGALYINDPWPVGTGTKRMENIGWLNAKMDRKIPLHYMP